MNKILIILFIVGATSCAIIKEPTHIVEVEVKPAQTAVNEPGVSLINSIDSADMYRHGK